MPQPGPRPGGPTTAVTAQAALEAIKAQLERESKKHKGVDVDELDRVYLEASAAYAAKNDRKRAVRNNYDEASNMYKESVRNFKALRADAEGVRAMGGGVGDVLLLWERLAALVLTPALAPCPGHRK